MKQDPAVENVLAFVGGNAAQNQGRMFVVLKPLNERKISADQVIARLRPKLSHVPGATLVLPGRAGFADRRAPVQCAVSVHAVGRKPG